MLFLLVLATTALCAPSPDWDPWSSWKSDPWKADPWKPEWRADPWKSEWLEAPLIIKKPIIIKKIPEPIVWAHPEPIVKTIVHSAPIIKSYAPSQPWKSDWGLNAWD